MHIIVIGLFNRVRNRLLASKKHGKIISLRINDKASNFSTETTQGTINFDEWIGDGCVVICSQSKDSTPVLQSSVGAWKTISQNFQNEVARLSAPVPTASAILKMVW